MAAMCELPVGQNQSARRSAMATDQNLRRSLLSDRLELGLLLVAQRSIEALERSAHQINRLLHDAEPPVHCIKANG